MTTEWQIFTGDYEKTMQDIRLKDGTEYIKCWPNAGVFIVMDNKIPDVPISEVTHIKKSQNWL